MCDDTKKSKDSILSQPMKGTWVLIAPDGKEYSEASPFRCLREEQKTRIPEDVAALRLFDAITKCVLCQKHEGIYTLAKGTPAEFGDVCFVCMNLIRTAPVHKTKSL